MEKFVVSARKYRPTGFEEVVGQEHITTTLQNAIDTDQLAQALLFCGPRGVGKTTCARILARLVNKFEQSSSDLGLQAGTPMNIYELDAASNNSVDDIRNLIDQVRYPPQQGRYKVYIIDEVHMLSNQAFNAFLKTLEEPPSYAIFILATTEKHKVIPTILSRCQIFDFNRIQIQDIARYLKKIADKEDIEVEEEALNLISQKADGALRDALSIFDLIVTFSSDRKVTYQNTIDNLHILDYDYYFKITDALQAENLAHVLLTYDEILRKGFDGHNFIVGLSEHFRNLLVCKDEATIRLLEVSDAVRAKYLKQAREVSLSFLLSALHIASQCDINFKTSKNQRLHVELTLMKMAYLNAAIKVSQPAPSIATEPEKKNIEVNPEKTPLPPESSSIKEQKPEPYRNGNAKDLNPVNSAGLSQLKNKSTVKIPSLKDIHSYQREDTQEVAVMEEEPAGQQKNEAIQLDELKMYWQEFANKKRAQGKDSEYTILNQEITLESDGVTVPIVLSNPLQEDIFNNCRAELLQHLRQQLNNYKLRVQTQVIRESAPRKLYTPSEKFQYLMGKYPELKNLRDRLGLDPDF